MLGNSYLDNKYSVIKQVGKGAQGSVYLAVDKNTTQNVAIKRMVIRKTDNQDLETAINKALIEINLLKTVSAQPNCNIYISCYIEHVVDWENGIIYLVMEYIDGPSLDKYVVPLYVSNDANKLIEVVFKTVKAIAEALKHIHNQGILHQDIKPQNIVVQEQTGIPKLVDFGLACQALDRSNELCLSPYDDDSSVKNIIGECCLAGGGTFAYMAPERILYNVRYPQSDIWSLGASMYTILTGKLIWGAREINNTTNTRIQTSIYLEEPEEIDSPNTLLNNLINGMTKKNILDRLNLDQILDMLKFV